MKCIILCASHDEEPKSLTKIDENLTALDLLIEQVSLIDDIDYTYIVTNGQSYEKFEDMYNNIDKSKIKLINDNTTSPKAKLGAIGDMKYTINMENIEDDLLIVAGDAIYDFEFIEMYEIFKDKKAPIIAVKDIKDVEDLKKYGTISFDKSLKITDMHEKNNNAIGDHIALALYMFPKKVIRILENYLQEGNLRTSPGYFIEYLYQILDIYAYEIKGNYFTLK